METTELTRLVHTHESELLRFAVTLLGDEALAQDAVQDAFNALSGCFFVPRNPRAWLYRVTKNKALNILRSRRKLHFTCDMPEVCDHVNVPEKDMELSDRESVLKKAVSELPPGQRAVLVLRFYENMSYGEIARCMGVSSGTVASQLHDALCKMELLLKDRFSEEVS